MSMNIIMAVILAVSKLTSRKPLQVKRPDNTVIKIAPNAPIEAASVGAAMPPTIEPNTATTKRIGGTTTFIKRTHN